MVEDFSFGFQNTGPQDLQSSSNICVSVNTMYVMSLHSWGKNKATLVANSHTSVNLPRKHQEIGWFYRRPMFKLLHRCYFSTSRAKMVHRMVKVGRDLWRLPGPSPLLNPGCHLGSFPRPCLDGYWILNISQGRDSSRGDLCQSELSHFLTAQVFPFSEPF